GRASASPSTDSTVQSGTSRRAGAPPRCECSATAEGGSCSPIGSQPITKEPDRRRLRCPDKQPAIKEDVHLFTRRLRRQCTGVASPEVQGVGALRARFETQRVGGAPRRTAHCFVQSRQKPPSLCL